MVATRSSARAAAPASTTTKRASRAKSPAKKPPARAKSPAKKPAARAKSPARKSTAKRGKKTQASAYDRALTNYPLLTNGIQAGVLSFASAVASQALAGTPASAFDYEKPAQFAAVAALVVTPLSLVFFGLVQKFSTPMKLAFDFAIAGPALNVAFVAALHAVRFQGFDAVLATLSSKEDFWIGLVLASNKVWLPAKVAMYLAVPPRYWGLWCAMVSFVWGIILAIIVA